MIREDPDQEGLVYAGTEFGIFVSADNGLRWQPLQLNLPVTPVTDIKVFRKDLVLSTMGRGFWILDDIAPLHDLVRPAPSSSTVRLLPPREAVRARWAPMGSQPDEPDYPVAAARIDYLVSDGAARPSIEIVDANGKVVRTFPQPPAKPGLNRLAWDMRAGTGADAQPQRGARMGPLVPPGTYQVRLKADNAVQTQTLQIVADARLLQDGITSAHLQEQYDFNVRLIDTIARARQLASTLEAALKSSTAQARQDALRALRARLVTSGGPYPQPMLIDQLQNILRMTSQADQRIGRDAYLRLDDLEKELKEIEAAAR